MEVELVETHRTKKDMQQMPLFERFIAEGNEKADEFAKSRSVDGWRTYFIGKSSNRKENKFMQHCNVQQAFTVWWKNGRIVKEVRPKRKKKWTFVNKKGEAKKHRTVWCAAANKYRCMRCGRTNGNVRDQSGCEKIPNPNWVDGANHILGGHDMARRVDRDGQQSIWCRKCSVMRGKDGDQN